MSRLVRPIVLVLAGLLAGCAATGAPSPSASVFVVGSGADITPLVVDQEFGVGKNHFVLTLVDQSNKQVASPETSVTVAFAGPGSSAPSMSVVSQFTWTIEGQKGYYVTDATFPTAGDWSATVTSTPKTGQAETAVIQFTVKDKTSAVMIGQKAPATKTPTLADVGGDVKQISTDAKPDPRFYQVSVDQALAQHKPFVLVFATPAFCTSAQCGPTLDRVKALATKFPAMTFINVEPYKLQFADGQLQPVLDANKQLQATDATNAWGILTEPWTFVVDKTGTVSASFELIFSDDELTAAINAVK
jgi:hypothetical protein